MFRVSRASALFASAALVLAGCAKSEPLPTRLDVGVCFDKYFTDQGILQGFQILDCGDEHDAELLLQYEASGEDFDVSPLVTEAVQRCGGAFLEFVGIDPADSPYDYDAFLPTEEQWGRGERTVFCYAYDESGKIKGSLRGTGA